MEHQDESGFKTIDHNPKLYTCTFMVYRDVNNLIPISRYIVYQQNQDGTFQGYVALKRQRHISTLRKYALGDYFHRYDTQDEAIERVLDGRKRKIGEEPIEHGKKPMNYKIHPARLDYMKTRYSTTE